MSNSEEIGNEVKVQKRKGTIMGGSATGGMTPRITGVSKRAAKGAELGGGGGWSVKK